MENFQSPNLFLFSHQESKLVTFCGRGEGGWRGAVRFDALFEGHHLAPCFSTSLSHGTFLFALKRSHSTRPTKNIMKGHIYTFEIIMPDGEHIISWLIHTQSACNLFGCQHTGANVKVGSFFPMRLTLSHGALVWLQHRGWKKTHTASAGCGRLKPLSLLFLSLTL